MEITFVPFYIYLLVAAALILWLVPATLLTLKVCKIKSLSTAFKRQLILPLWLLPIVGNLVCYMVFAKVGTLTPLTNDERKRYWRS